jgi:LysM repeat protein
MRYVRSLALAFILVVLFAAAAPRHVSADTAVVVQAGDNLYRIALRFGTTVDAIVRANGLSSANRVFAGQRLVVPGGGWSGGGGAGGGATLPSQGVAGRHVIQAGDNLYRIALRYGTTVGAIVRANGLPSADHIYAGQSIVIPGAGGVGSGGEANVPTGGGGGGAGRRIVVDLSSQTLSAYEGAVAVQTFIVSTGKASTPTPVGTYQIYARYASQTMYGPGYYLPGVPYVQYFTGAYAIHGTYWHTAFGTPVSHGCVNLTEADAGWLWRWAGAGTTVVVQY